MQINEQAKVSDNPQALILKKDSQKLRCPYVHKHRVQSRVFAAHIQKCRASLPKKILNQFATCKYNSLHIFSIYYIDAHQLTCPNRQNMIDLQQLLIDRPKILQEQISQITSQSSKKSKQTVEKADQLSYFNNIPSQKLRQGDEKSRQEQQMQETQISNKKINERFHQNSKRKKVSNKQVNFSKSKSKSKFQLHLNMRLQQIEEMKKWNESCDKQQRHQSDHEGQNNKQKELQLYECPDCCQILSNLETKLWKNKKLVKLLKAYSKLQKEQSEIQQFMKVKQKILKIQNKIEDSQRQVESLLIQSNIQNESKGSLEITDLSQWREQSIELIRKQTIEVGSQDKEEVQEIPKQSIRFEQNQSLNIGLLDSVCNKKQRAKEMAKKNSDELQSNWVVIKD